MLNPTYRDLVKWLETFSQDELDLPVSVVIVGAEGSLLLPADALTKTEITDESGETVQGTLPHISLSEKDVYGPEESEVVEEVVPAVI